MSTYSEYIYKYPGSDFSEGTSVVQLSDGSYCVAVYAYKNKETNNDLENGQILLLKLDSKGENHHFIPVNIDSLYDNSRVSKMILVKDGEEERLIITGHIQVTSDGKNDFLLMKVKPDGEVIWDRRFDHADKDLARSVIQTKDEGFLIVGKAEWNNGGTTSIIYKTDKEGLIE
jgi:hypothetical protein